MHQRLKQRDGPGAPQVGSERPSSLIEIATLFLKLGTISFGGPAAHIALMEEEIVRKRRWLNREEFLDLLGATNLIPGPNSTELAIHIGYRQAGFPGLVLAGACFIIPATLIVTAIAWAYVEMGSLPEVTRVFRSVKPIMIAIVLQALWGLAKTALKSSVLIVITAASLILTAGGVHELLVLFVAGAAAALAGQLARRPSTMLSVELAPLFLFFLKTGSVLFGSGYVLLAFLRSDLVERWQWLLEGQLLDAIAVGQITPGPVFTTATFIGYVLAGVPGAAIATIGIFLPIRVCCDQRPPRAPHPQIENGRRRSRRSECRIARSNGCRDFTIGPRRNCRCSHSLAGVCGDRRSFRLSHQFGLAGFGCGRGRFDKV
jgi:chromate transporter